MAVISNTKVQIGKETTWGTAVAATAIIPVNADPTFSSEFAAVRDQGRRGLASMDYQLLQGGGSAAITLDGNATPIGVGHLLYAVFGSVSTGAAVSSVYPHTFSVGSTTPAYTIEDANPTQTRKYAGAKASEVAFAFTAADGMLTARSTWRSKTGATGSATTGLTAETAKPWLGIDASISLASVSNARVTSFDLTIAREQNAIHAAGSRDPIRIDEGPLECTGSIAFDAGASPVDDLAKYIGSSGAFTEEAMVIACSYGATTTLRAITFTLTNANYGEGPATRDLGTGLYQVTLNFRGIYNTTDSGPLKVLLNNTQSSY
jgi:hypothetical protein